ncbi:hypothetical protein J7M00_00300 [bacterium]|nr:hypothetical protein [bacterium]
MKLLSAFIFLLLILSLFGKEIPMTRWIDPIGGKPITPDEYEKKFGFPKSPLRLGRIMKSQTEDSLVDIVVNSSLWGELEDEILNFSEDLISDGYSIVIDTMGGGSADELRDHLSILLLLARENLFFPATLQTRLLPAKAMA